MSSEIRQQRVAGTIFEELTIMLAGELQDPRISLVTVTDVRVSKDLRNVRVFVSHDDESVTRRELLQALRSATPYVRTQLAKRLALRAAPELYFSYDDAPEQAARVDEILRQIAVERASADPASADPASADPASADPASAGPAGTVAPPTNA